MGDMADFYFEQGWNRMCEFDDGGDDYGYERDYFLGLAEWLDLQRGDPRVVFDDGFTE